MTKTYEFVALFSPELSEKELQEAQDFVVDLVKKYEGEIINTDVWGKKFLAYSIGKLTEAFYVYYDLNLPTQNVQDFDKDVRLSGKIIRHLVVIKDAKKDAKQALQDQKESAE